jgi:hypothetical protein
LEDAYDRVAGVTGVAVGSGFTILAFASGFTTSTNHSFSRLQQQRRIK